MLDESIHPKTLGIVFETLTVLRYSTAGVIESWAKCPSTRPFHLSQGFALCAGNFFFAGARTFFRSLEAAIFLFSRVARLPAGSAVIPAISTDERITLGAQLADGQRLRGQNMISHPPPENGTSAVCKDGACHTE
jgi:hypothetical protein